MRIGILTFHSAYNYGAVLQCYALQEYLKSLGHAVYVIDYRNQFVMDVYKSFDLKRFRNRNLYGILSQIYREIKFYKAKKQRGKTFDEFIFNHFNLTPISTIVDNPFDLIVVGSDQVWNFVITHGFDQYYWGDFSRPKVTKIVSYAASMQDKWTDADEKVIAKKLLNFDRISVRESSLRDKIQKIIPDKVVYSVVDPTLLLKQEQWNKIAENPIIDSPYLLLYQVENSKKNEIIANSIASERNLKIVKLSAAVDMINTPSVRNSSPAEFLGLFKYASYVVCSSFHGTIFSIIFHRPFVSINNNKGKNARVESLLDSLNLSDRFIDEYTCISDDYCIDNNIYYEMVYNSKSFLADVTER